MNLREFSDKIRHRSELMAEVVSACKSLLDYPEAKNEKDYIESRVGKVGIKNYDIGWFPPDNQLDLLTSLVSEKTLKQLNFVFETRKCNRSHFEVARRSLFNYHNIIFPFSDEYGNLVTLSGRTSLSEEERKDLGVPKYKNSSFKKEAFLYGLYESKFSIFEKNYVIVVEGQIDCISCQLAGYPNTVALTFSDLTDLQVFSLLRRSDNFIFLLDNDKAGLKAKSKITKKYSEFANLWFGKVPEKYKDVDLFIKDGNNLDIILPTEFRN